LELENCAGIIRIEIILEITTVHTAQFHWAHHILIFTLVWVEVAIRLVLVYFLSPHADRHAGDISVIVCFLFFFVDVLCAVTQLLPIGRPSLHVIFFIF